MNMPLSMKTRGWAEIQTEKVTKRCEAGGNNTPNVLLSTFKQAIAVKRGVVAQEIWILPETS